MGESMSKRRAFLTSLVCIAIGAVLLGAHLSLPPGPGVTQANFDRVRDGMTRDEVGILFGRPPDLNWQCGEHGSVDIWFVGSERGDDEFRGAILSYCDGRIECGSSHFCGPSESIFERLMHRISRP